jgi:hypothetical protein
MKLTLKCIEDKYRGIKYKDKIILSEFSPYIVNIIHTGRLPRKTNLIQVKNTVYEVLSVFTNPIKKTYRNIIVHLGVLGTTKDFTQYRLWENRKLIQEIKNELINNLT